MRKTNPKQSAQQHINMQAIEDLNKQFALPGHLHFEAGPADLAHAVFNSPLAQARMSLQGAHLMSWQPRGQQPVIWMSERAQFAQGLALRGGVPLCWPWFGAKPASNAHGFARTAMWQITDSMLHTDGRVQLRLGLRDSPSTRELWNQGFELLLNCTMGADLRLELCTRNTGATPMTLTQALHSYFCVGDITRTQVLGLEGCTYLDKVQDFAPMRQHGAIRFTNETDRVYVDTTADCIIEDEAWGRRIRVAKQGSLSTVVWNPWLERASALSDMAPQGYRHMLCVETCNAGPDQITVEPGGQHCLSAHISVSAGSEAR